MHVDLHPHQQTAVNQLENGKILRGDPGVGKSFTALAYFYIKECGGVLNDWGSIKTPKNIYIITTAKKRESGDWQKDAHYLGLMEDPEISVAGIKVTVDSWNNIEKYEEVENAFFIFDEQKVVGSGVWAKTFIKIARANRWIILTGTPGDVWMDYASVFIANGFYKNITEFKRQHVEYDPWVKFPKIKRYHKLGLLVRHRNEILVEMLYKRHTTRHVDWLSIGHDAEELERVTKKRWHVYEERPLTGVAELFSVARKVVNSDPARLDQIRELLKKHPKLIVFYNFDYELELLRTLAHGSEISSSPKYRDPWDYLLSPEGQQENSPQPSSSRSSPKSSSTTGSGTTSTGGSVSNRLLEKLAERERTKFHSDSGDIPRHLYDTPSTSGPLDPQLEARLTRLLNGPTLSMEELLKRSSTTSSGADFARSAAVGDTGKSTGSPSSGTSPTRRPSVEDGSYSSRLVDDTSSTTTYEKSSSGSSVESLLTPSPTWSGPAEITVAEWNGHKHQPIPETDSWIYLVQYRAGAEAWNCTETDAMVFYSMTYSYKDFEQCQGRIDRMNTPFTDLWYHVLYSDSWIDKAVKKALDEKHDFNESRYKRWIDMDKDIYTEELVGMMATAA